MKAMVYHGANDIHLEEKPKPVILESTDAVVRVVKPQSVARTWAFGKAKTPKLPMGAFWGTRALAWWKRLALR